MSTTTAPNKAVHLMFLSGGLLLFFLLMWTGDWVASFFVRTPNDFLVQGIAAVVAFGVGLTLYRSESVRELAIDVASELGKVTWPTKKETQASTVVVIVTSVIAALVVFLLDLAWSSLTKLVYGG